jgi:hypothetical protein
VLQAQQGVDAVRHVVEVEEGIQPEEVGGRVERRVEDEAGRIAVAAGAGEGQLHVELALPAPRAEDLPEVLGLGRRDAPVDGRIEEAQQADGRVDEEAAGLDPGAARLALEQVGDEPDRELEVVAELRDVPPHAAGGDRQPDVRQR